MSIHSSNTTGWQIYLYNGRVVKKFADGHIEKISPIEAVNTNDILAPD
jgi:hypothetical protein